MDERNVIEYKDFGELKFNLEKLLEEKRMTPFQLSSRADVDFRAIKKMIEGEPLSRINVDVICKICYVLRCNVSDLMEYIDPEK